jgi:hypothetical protein
MDSCRIIRGWSAGRDVIYTWQVCRVWPLPQFPLLSMQQISDAEKYWIYTFIFVSLGTSRLTFCSSVEDSFSCRTIKRLHLVYPPNRSKKLKTVLCPSSRKPFLEVKGFYVCHELTYMCCWWSTEVGFNKTICLLHFIKCLNYIVYNWSLRWVKVTALYPYLGAYPYLVQFCVLI